MLTGEENLRMMARLRHLPPRAARDHAARLLAEFDLEDRAGAWSRPTRAACGAGLTWRSA